MDEDVRREGGRYGGRLRRILQNPCTSDGTVYCWGGNYASQLGDGVKNGSSQYDSWRLWLQNNVRVEPMNEVNANLSGEQVFAADLDSQVKAGLLANGVAIKGVVASSIISGTSAQYLSCFSAYYAHGGPTDATPNIHLYFDETTDDGGFASSITRFQGIVGTQYTTFKMPVLVGEIGESYRNYPGWRPAGDHRSRA